MIFDGPNLLVVLEQSDGDLVTALDIYSEWKSWVQSGDGAGYPAAFRAIGGDPLGGGVFAGSYFFLQTPSGWRIRPREAAHELTIDGNLFVDADGDDLFVPTLGAFQVQIQLTTSSLTQQVAAGATDPVVLDRITDVWRAMGLDPANPAVHRRDESIRVPSDGALINQTITVAGDTVTVERVP